jgi:FkbM family methyltransferase
MKLLAGTASASLSRPGRRAGISSRQRWLYEKLFALRPTQFASFFKRLLRIQRREMRSENGCVYWADPVSVFGLQLLRGNTYEAELTQLLVKLLKAGDTFIDAGANEGYYAMLAAQLGCTVHCIEPQARLRSVIRRNIELNSARGVRLHPLALSNTNGQARLYLRPTTNTGASSFFRHWRIGWSSEDVPTRRLDDFFVENQIEKARLMKIDCEGAECLIVEGGTRSLSAPRIEFIVIEYHPEICGQPACEAIHDRLVDSGYRSAQIDGINLYYAPQCEREVTALKKGNS